jgi:prepilin-type N-terminal cleavage/methylation domain-containing protein
MHQPDCRQSGFTLIEVLLALTVLAIGTLALSSLQLWLDHGTAVARQRSDAVRLAQTQLEQLRSFDRLSSASGHLAHADIAGGSDAPAAAIDAGFERRWTVAQPSRFEKRVVVEVDWTDRHGQLQRARLSTLLAGVEPADSGALAAPPPAGAMALPADGLPPVPGAAHYLGRGLSALQWPGSGSYLVFDAGSGRTRSRCIGTVSTGLGLDNVCSTPFEATIVSGSIGGLPAGFDSDAQAAALVLELAPGHSAAAQPECIVGRLPTGGPWPQRPGAAAPAAGVGASYHYACLVRVAGPGEGWSGQLRIAPGPGSLLGARDRFCALSWERNASAVRGDANEEHPIAYLDVRRSLAAQNFLFVPRIDGTTPDACPPDATVNSLAVSYLPLPPL